MMAKTNWKMGDTVLPDDLNQIGQEINDKLDKSARTIPDLLPNFSDYNELTTSGLYHGVYYGPKLNEPVTDPGDRRVTVAVFSGFGVTAQKLVYENGAGQGRIYFRLIEETDWVEVWTSKSDDGFVTTNKLADGSVKPPKIGSITLDEGADLNDVKAPGFYRLRNQHLNAPPGVEDGQMIVCSGVDTIFQIATGWENSQFYMRQGNPDAIGGNGSWQPWRRLWHDGNDRGFMGAPILPPLFEDYNELTTPGEYHFVYENPKVNEPFAEPGPRRVTLTVLAGMNATMQTLKYDHGVGEGRIYFRILENNTKGWITVWTSESDGHGSGLDADTLDGVHASDFVRDFVGNKNGGHNAIFLRLTEVPGEGPTVLVDVDLTENVPVGLARYADTVDGYHADQFAKTTGHNVIHGLYEFALGKIQIGSSTGLKRYIRFDGYISEDDQVYHEIWNSGNNIFFSTPYGGASRFANGLMFQWSRVTNIAPNTPITHAFPVAFPNYTFIVVATVDSTVPSPVSVFNITNTKCDIVHNDPVNRDIMLLAVGY